jgi:multidrug resistance protein, MATE family
MNSKQLLKHTLSLAIPTAISRGVAMLTGFIGIFMLAQINNDVLAASSLITSTQAMITVISFSIFFSMPVLMGHAFGQKDYDSIGVIMQHGILLAILVSIPGFLLFYYMKPILIAFGQNPKLAAIAGDYFHYFAFALPMLFLNIAISQLLLATKKQNLFLAFAIFALIVSQILAYVFIFGKLGAPKMGVRGLGLAYIIQNALTLVLAILYLRLSKNIAHYRILQFRLHRNWALLRRMFTLGWPIVVQTAGDLVTFFIMTLMIGWLGKIPLAASQVSSQFFLLLVIPIFALQQTSGILVSQAYGEKQFSLINRVSHMVLYVGLVFALFVAALFIFFPHVLINAYLATRHFENPAMIQLAIYLMMLTGLRVFFDTIVQIKTGSLRGLFDTRKPMFIVISLRWFIGLPLAYFLGFICHFGAVGVSIGTVTGVMLAAVFMWRRWHRVLACTLKKVKLESPPTPNKPHTSTAK